VTAWSNSLKRRVVFISGVAPPSGARGPEEENDAKFWSVHTEHGLFVKTGSGQAAGNVM
jgi:hypothetical protein